MIRISVTILNLNNSIIMITLTRAAAVPSRKTRSKTLETKPSGKWAAKMVRNQGVAYREGSASSLTNRR